ncbi:MAG: serine/threonine-protein kinase, partial [Polyangiales bacterium]
MGVVYDAWDEQRSAHVALKVLSRATPGGIYRFKNEFRALADLSHPNLAALHELVAVEDRWLLTMELIRGVDFLRWVRAGWDPREADTVESTPSETQWVESDEIEQSAIRRAKRTCDVDRLRDSLRQLARGLIVLHRGGFLHRDIKPSNVLVRDDGHVKVLDFGLIRDEQALHASLDDKVVGTPAYMAPEQAAGRDATAASDWYAVGVMIYEALTGVLPYEGTVLQVLAHKQHRDPPHPATLVADAPSDLADLAMALLQRDPGERPGEEHIVGVLEDRGPAAVSVPAPAPRGATPFVGRERQLRELREVYEATRLGAPAVVHVRGPSGVGKSALVRCFLDELHAEHDAVVLAGRCYERESVPFKALDSVIDALSRYLRGLD